MSRRTTLLNAGFTSGVVASMPSVLPFRKPAAVSLLYALRRIRPEVDPAARERERRVVQRDVQQLRQAQARGAVGGAAKARGGWGERCGAGAAVAGGWGIRGESVEGHRNGALWRAARGRGETQAHMVGERRRTQRARQTASGEWKGAPRLWVVSAGWRAD